MRPVTGEIFFGGRGLTKIFFSLHVFEETSKGQVFLISRSFKPLGIIRSKEMFVSQRVGFCTKLFVFVFNHNVETLLPPCWCASSLCILEHTHNLRSKWTRAENTIMMMAIMVAMMMPMMMAMMIAMMMLMIIRTHLDGVPLVANPGVGLIGGELGHHVSV